MDTIKTAVVVMLLLAVLYGVYLVLNKPDHAPPPEVTWGDDPAELAPPDISFGGPSADEGDPAAAPSVESPPSDFGQPITEPTDEAPVRVPAESATAYGTNNYTQPYQASGGSPVPASSDTDDEPEVPQASYQVEADYNGGREPGAEPPSSQLPITPRSDSSIDVAVQDPVDVAPLGDPTRNAPAHGGSLDRPTPRSPSVEEGPSSSSSVYSSPSASSNAGESLPQEEFQRAVADAQAQIDNENYREALFTLSLLYTKNTLTESQRTELHNWLDPLAGRVIYSREHLMAPAHEVQRDETLSDIATRYRVPWELLRNINGIENPKILVPGTELKVVPGPFSAEVDLEQRELRLFVGPYYAGRFPVSFGNDPAPAAGVYSVKGKEQGRTYYAKDGQVVPAGSPQNPYGNYWIDLGGDSCIHGSPTVSDGTDAGGGCISLSPIDARDIFEILSPGSKVTIQ